MANIQNDPRYDIATNLGGIILAQWPQIKNAKRGWPDRKWLQVETNLPAVYFVDITRKGQHYVSQNAVHREIKNADGTGQIVRERLRLHTLLQMSLFTNTKSDRDALGWQFEQYFFAQNRADGSPNYRIEILDYTKATPAPTGEYMMLYYRGDHEDPGEANLYRRDLTLEVQTRVLDAIPGHSASRIVVAQTLLTDPAATLPQ